MKEFSDFVEGIKKDIVVPKGVNERFEETLGGLSDVRGKRSGRFLKTAAAAASFVLVCTVVFASNPALASYIPFDGNIFRKVESKVSFSGDYSKSQKLVKEPDEDSVLTAEDKGVRLTASEVYSDSYSVFVTLKMDSERFDFSKCDTVADTGGEFVNMMTSYGIGREPDVYDYDILLDGTSKGKHTFIGMMKFDKPDCLTEDGFVSICVRSFLVPGQDDKELKGNWRLKIPFETDRENGREIAVDKKLGGGMTVKKLFISPYQFVVMSDVPYTTPYANFSDKKIIKEYGMKLNEMAVMKQADMVKEMEEIRKTREYAFYEYAVFDQDGNRLEYENRNGDGREELRKDVYSLRGKKVSMVHIYVTQKEKNVFDLVKAKTEKAAKAKSEHDFVVELS